MAAVLLALCSAVAFGSLAVTLTFALRRCRDAELGAFATVLAALIPVGIVALARFDWSWQVWPYLLGSNDDGSRNWALLPNNLCR